MIRGIEWGVEAEVVVGGVDEHQQAKSNPKRNEWLEIKPSESRQPFFDGGSHGSENMMRKKGSDRIVGYLDICAAPRQRPAKRGLFFTRVAQMAKKRKRVATTCEKYQTPPFPVAYQYMVPSANRAVSHICVPSFSLNARTTPVTTEAFNDPTTTDARA